MPRVTRSAINAALGWAGFAGVTLEQGRGYFYFAGGNTARWPETAVYTNRLTALSVDEWIIEAKRLAPAQSRADKIVVGSRVSTSGRTIGIVTEIKTDPGHSPYRAETIMVAFPAPEGGYASTCGYSRQALVNLDEPTELQAAVAEIDADRALEANARAAAETVLEALRFAEASAASARKMVEDALAATKTRGRIGIALSGRLVLDHVLASRGRLDAAERLAAAFENAVRPA